MAARIIDLIQEGEGVGITFDKPIDACDAFHILKSLHAFSHAAGYTAHCIKDEEDTRSYSVINGSLQFEIKTANNVPPVKSRKHFAYVPSSNVSNRFIDYFRENRK